MVRILLLLVTLQMDEVHAVVFKGLVAFLALIQVRVWVSNNAVNAAAVVKVIDVVVTTIGAVAVTSVYVAVVVAVDVYIAICVSTAYVTIAFAIVAM